MIPPLLLFALWMLVAVMQLLAYNNMEPNPILIVTAALSGVMAIINFHKHLKGPSNE